MTDGNLISKGVGDGEAHIVQPFMPDQSAFLQMNQVLAQKQAQKAKAAADAREKEADKKDALIKQLGSYKYHPLDNKNITDLKNRLEEKIVTHKQGESFLPIQQELEGFAYAVEQSRQSLEKDNDLDKMIRDNKDNVWIDGEDDWRSSLVETPTGTLEDLMTSIGKREAKRDLVRQSAPKVKNLPQYINQAVSQLKPNGYKESVRKDASGQWVRELTPIYDTKQTDELFRGLYNNTREAKQQFADEASFIAFGNTFLNQAPKITAKYEPNNAGSGWKSGGGGRTNGYLTLTDEGKVVMPNKEGTEAAWRNYNERFQKKIEEAGGETTTQGQAYKNAQLSKAEFEKKYSQTKAVDFVSIESIKTLAENGKRDFYTEDGEAIEGKVVGINRGKGTLMIGIDDVRTVGGKKVETKYFEEVPMSRNPKFFDDNKTTADAVLIEAQNISSKGKNKSVTLPENNKRGNEKTKLIQVYPKTQQEWDNAPKGSFYITKSGKKITK